MHFRLRSPHRGVKPCTLHFERSHQLSHAKDRPPALSLSSLSTELNLPIADSTSPDNADDYAFNPS